jgi:hypothetical protein
MDDARKLGERNWRNAARNRDSWQKLLRKALAQKGLLCNDDDDDDDDCLPHRPIKRYVQKNKPTRCHLKTLLFLGTALHVSGTHVPIIRSLRLY